MSIFQSHGIKTVLITIFMQLFIVTCHLLKVRQSRLFFVFTDNCEILRHVDML